MYVFLSCQPLHPAVIREPNVLFAAIAILKCRHEFLSDTDLNQVSLEGIIPLTEVLGFDLNPFINKVYAPKLWRIFRQLQVPEDHGYMKDLHAFCDEKEETFMNTAEERGEVEEEAGSPRASTSQGGKFALRSKVVLPEWLPLTVRLVWFCLSICLDRCQSVCRTYVGMYAFIYS